MKSYTLQGIHCPNCAEKLGKKLKTLENGKESDLDYQKQTLSISEKMDLNSVKKVLAFDKVILFPEETHADKAVPENELGHFHHGHDHGSATIQRTDRSVKNIQIVFFINIFFAVFEFIFGFLFNSAAIISDAVHDLGDSVSVGMAWFFQRYSTKEANDRFSFGYRRFSLIGALVTAVVLLTGAVLVIINSIPLLMDPQPVNARGMFWLSIIAIGINSYAAWLVSKGSSANESMLNLHMLEDVLGWIGVLIVSVVLNYTEFYILDPLLSIAIAVFIFSQAMPKFIHAVTIFLDAVPEDADIKGIEKQILQLPQVNGVSHLHIWSIDGEENAMSVTLFISDDESGTQEKIKEEIYAMTKELNITHSTIETVLDENGLINQKDLLDQKSGGN